MTRVETLVPAVGWLRTYDRASLSKDVVGGLAAGAVVIPQAMAYATIADLPVQVGLYTCMGRRSSTRSSAGRGRSRSAPPPPSPS